MNIALFHFHVTQIKRSAGQSAVAAAAYRAGERLHSEYYGEDSDYTRKGGVVCSEILLPSHAPPEYADREMLWNAVEKAERGKKAQLAYSFDIALQNEFSMQENIDLARQFLSDNFVSRGMVVDFAVHQPDKETAAFPTHIFTSCVPSVPSNQTADGAISNGGNMCWTSMGNAFWTRRAIMYSTPSPQRTGVNRRRWKCGGRRGLTCATPSLPKKA